MAVKTPTQSVGTSAGGTPAAAPAPEGAAVSPKPGVKPKAEPTANPQLVAIIEKYDEKVSEAETFFIEMVEFIQTNQLDRNTVVASMMLARGVTFESAQSQYSRMKKILNDETVLAELKEGKITLKVARERTTTPQKQPKSSAPEAKEAKYNAALKAFIACAKESGFTLREIMIGVEADAKAAGIK